jgi:predicted adenylyl cyclase CyaB
MRNLELKARCADLEAARARAERLGARPVETMHQRDTFYAAPRARLKLREVGEGRGELIAYHRADVAAARSSDYEIYATDDAAGLGAVLAEALGVSGTVEKRRRLLCYGRTRIHLDEVAGLGTFVELETVLAGQSEDEARAELDRVMRALELRPEDVVARAYVDLGGEDAR